MRHVVDGSNLLGALGLPRESDEAKRELVRRLASFSRSARCPIDCVFDGARPDGFATHFGGLVVRFSHPKSGDEVIVRIIDSTTAPAVVITNDRALGHRVKNRKVRTENCSDFRRRLDSARAAEDRSGGDDTDWETYFSDSKNRNV